MNNTTLYDDSDGSFNEPFVLIVDFVFHRKNRNYSIAYSDDILSLFGGSVSRNNDNIWHRLLLASPSFILYFLSLLFNGILLFMNVKRPRKRRWKRIQVLIANLAFCNILLIVGFATYMLLIDVFYSVGSIEQVVVEGWKFADYCYAALKEALKQQIVHNLGYVQLIFLFFIAIDGYQSLFIGYESNFHSKWAPVLITILPYILVAVCMDQRIICSIFNRTTAVVICAVGLIFPCLLATVITICTIIRQERGDALYRSRDITYAVSLLIILSFESFQKTALFFEFLNRNFLFDFVIGDHDSDIILSEAIDTCYQVAHYFFLLSPFYISVIMLLVIHRYRKSVICALRNLYQSFLCGKRNNKVDYNCETMRSIIADQTREKRMRSYGNLKS